MSWKIDPAATGAIFANADTDIDALKQQHTKVRNETDDAQQVFTDPKCNPIEAALAKSFNRVLTHEMTAAEAHADALVTAGRNALDAYNHGQEQMVSEYERNAGKIPDPHIFDGKQVPK